MQWVLNVTDAGPRALRFIALAHQDETPGCEATAKNPRSRVEISGVTNYSPHSSGQTTFIYRPQMYDCGRVQVDVSIFDAAGNEILVLGTVINYGTQCTPQQPTLSCVPSPTNPNPAPGIPLTFNVVATNPPAGAVYTWSAPGATPATFSSTGTSFTTQWNNPTNGLVYQITPTGPQGAASSPCTVIFNTVETTICSSAAGNPLPVAGQPWTGTFNVLNPQPSVTYTWTATGGTLTPATNGLSTVATFPANTGTTTTTYSVQLMGNGVPLPSTLCTVVQIPPPGAFCSPAAGNPTPVTGQPWTGSFVVTNPQTGRTYNWTTASGAPSSGSGLTFTVTFPANMTNASVTHSVQLSDAVSGALPSSTCTVTLPPVGDPPVCAASPTNPLPVPGQPWTGTYLVVPPVAGQTYTWAATGGSPSSGSGLSFTVSYPANLTSSAITYNVQLSGNGVPLPSSACTVTLPPPPPPPPAICVAAPSNPLPVAGQPWTGTFNVQNAQAGQTYSWAAAGGSPSSGSGLSFTVSYPANLTSAAITYTVQASGNGVPLPSSTCTVTLPPPPPPQSSCVAAPTNPLPVAGQPWSGAFNVQNPQAGQTYSWAATGGTPSSGTGLSFPVSFPANLTTAPITYNVQLSSGGVPLPSTLCSVTLPPAPTVSCLGTTGRFTDITPLTLGAEVTVPPGRQASIVVEVFDRNTNIMTYLPALTFGPGTHAWTFNTACFVKINMLCVGEGGGFLDRQDSTNACTGTR